jgi:hypothetical protein
MREDLRMRLKAEGAGHKARNIAFIIKRCWKINEEGTERNLNC